MTETAIYVEDKRHGGGSAARQGPLSTSCYSPPSQVLGCPHSKSLLTYGGNNVHVMCLLDINKNLGLYLLVALPLNAGL